MDQITPKVAVSMTTRLYPDMVRNDLVLVHHFTHERRLKTLKASKRTDLLPTLIPQTSLRSPALDRNKIGPI